MSTAPSSAEGGARRGAARHASVSPLTRVARTFVATALLACGGAPATGSTTPSDEPGPELVLALQIHEAAPDPELDMPRSEVRVVLLDPSGERREESVGVYSGICQPAALSNALVGVSCWWAGAGDDLRVRREGDRLVVTRAQLDEMSEGELSEETLTTLELPPRATLRPLTGMP